MKQAIGIFLLAVHLLSSLYGHTLGAVIGHKHTLVSKTGTHKKQEPHKGLHVTGVKKGIPKRTSQQPACFISIPSSCVKYSCGSKVFPRTGRSGGGKYDSAVWQPPQ